MVATYWPSACVFNELYLENLLALFRHTFPLTTLFGLIFADPFSQSLGTDEYCVIVAISLHHTHTHTSIQFHTNTGNNSAELSLLKMWWAPKRALGGVIDCQKQSTWSWCTWSRPWFPRKRRAWPVLRAGADARQSGFPGTKRGSRAGHE